MLPAFQGRAARWAAAAVLGTGVGLTGVAAVFADDAPKADKKPADKKPEVDSRDVRVGPPPELAALRAAVESAAKKGENVDEIRKQLDALETALAGKAWVKPKPAQEPPPPVTVNPGRLPPNVFPGIQPGFGRVQPLQEQLEAMRKSQELLLRSMLLQNDPAQAEELMRQARELLAKGMLRPGVGGGFVLPVLPADRLNRGNGRLGVRVAEVPADLAEKVTDLPAGRGVLAAEIVPGSAAEKAGLKADDIIVEFAGKPVGDDPAEFVRTVQAVRTGQKVDIVLYRDGKKETVRGVTIGQPAAQAEPLDPPAKVRRD